MTKLLQMKFVKTAMIAISLLIILLLGAINIVNIIIVRNDIDKTLQLLTESQVEMNLPGVPPDSHIPNINPEGNNSRLLSYPYFIVRADNNENVIYVNVSHIQTVDENEAKELAEKVLKDEDTHGKLGGYRYIISSDRFGMGMIIAFLDASNEVYSYIRILVLSAGVGLAAWTLMLLLVIFLSKKAIRPIAENMEKQKEFITNAGHEIKTPLAIIQANTDAMELYSGENKWSKNIKQQIVRLDGLMKNLLFLTRSDENGLTANKTDFSLSEIILETANSFVEPMLLKGVELKISVLENICINADKEHITQLISILLDNALKYTTENGYAAIFLMKDQNNIYVQVKNTVSELPNVPPEKLFDRFYRADTARTQKSGGYGIGLSMAKAICEANNAAISVYYESRESIVFNVKF